MEDYIRWLLSLYEKQFGPVQDHDIVAQGVEVLRLCIGGLPGADEFASLVAAEVTDRQLLKPQKPFVAMLRTAANTVRKQIMRRIKRWHTNAADWSLGQVPTPPAADEATIDRIKAELLEGLSFEEQLVAEAMIAGVPVDEIAAKLDVSTRTVYRRLSDIQSRLGLGQYEARR